MDEILRLASVSRSFGAVKALRDISFSVESGEVVALCGDNGAGKSTLIRIISGADRPSRGTLVFKKEPVRFSSPAQALARGIATTYQDLALAPEMKLYENVFMGAELTRKSLIPGIRILDKGRMKREALGYLSRLNSGITDPEVRINTLSGGQRQAVAISRALRWQASLVIMDEPTAALGVKETRGVLDLISQLKDQGVTVLLISHTMEDIVAVADRAVILKGGKKAGECACRYLDPGDLGRMIMTGEV